jgi:hypothetical protein
MIATEFYDGQGLGNQLWCYVVTRLIAITNSYDFSIKNPACFKGKGFINIDFGHEFDENLIKNHYIENITRDNNGFDISGPDDNLFQIDDGTKIDGCMQSYSYITGKENLVKNFFNILDDTVIDGNICLIHIRGGDFRGSTAYLDSDYYKKSMEIIREINKNVIFKIITDDINFSRQLLPDIEIIGSTATNIPDSNKAIHHQGGDISIDFCLLKNCRYAIISASSFSWWAIFLNKNKEYVIAPKYWGIYRFNLGYWSTSDIITPKINYMSPEGKIFTYDECIKEKNI